MAAGDSYVSNFFALGVEVFLTNGAVPVLYVTVCFASGCIGLNLFQVMVALYGDVSNFFALGVEVLLTNGAVPVLYVTVCFAGSAVCINLSQVVVAYFAFFSAADGAGLGSGAGRIVPSVVTVDQLAAHCALALHLTGSALRSGVALLRAVVCSNSFFQRCQSRRIAVGNRDVRYGNIIIQFGGIQSDTLQGSRHFSSTAGYSNILTCIDQLSVKIILCGNYGIARNFSIGVRSIGVLYPNMVETAHCFGQKHIAAGECTGASAYSALEIEIPSGLILCKTENKRFCRNSSVQRNKLIHHLNVDTHGNIANILTNRCIKGIASVQRIDVNVKLNNRGVIQAGSQRRPVRCHIGVASCLAPECSGICIIFHSTCKITADGNLIFCIVIVIKDQVQGLLFGRFSQLYRHCVNTGLQAGDSSIQSDSVLIKICGKFVIRVLIIRISANVLAVYLQFINLIGID